MIKITGLIIPLAYDMQIIKDIAAEKLNVDRGCIENIKILKRSTDTSDKQDIHFKMELAVYLSGDENKVIFKNKNKNITKEEETAYIIPKSLKKLKQRPLIVGCGPAGMFAALILAEAGENPILLERGLDIDNRRKNVLSFWHNGVLDTNSNVQFGEGGAGAFSDGKLKTGYKDPRKIKVLNEFIEAGAPPEIMYLDKPHIGTDKLNDVVKGLRKKYLSLGGEVRFNANVTDILYKNGKVMGLGYLEKESNGIECHNEITTENIVLAIGHSARDTYEKLLKSGVHIEQRPFSVGVRIEHPQKLINRIQYGDFAEHPALGAADYRMVVHLKNGRGVYTFCMCPGGTVVAATSDINCLVTNGMSEYSRDGRNANTALLITLETKDFINDHPLAGVAFQRKIEETAFSAGGGGYKAPVQRLEDFLNKRNTSAFGEVLPTYKPGTSFAEAESYLPEYITESLRQGIVEMGLWMPGFNYPDALLTGVETRSSSPVRIARDENYEAIGIKGLYPCGEGAGYAGGIVSAAVDGILCAERILGNL